MDLATGVVERFCREGLTCPPSPPMLLSVMKKNTKTKKNQDQCNCPSCRAYEGRSILTPREKKKEEMDFLRSVGVTVEKAKTFEDALKMALR